MKIKVKLEHILADGGKLGFESYVEAEDYNSAQKTALASFQSTVKSLAQAGSISIDKSKIETGCDKH